jgi:hypothetical protein
MMNDGDKDAAQRGHTSQGVRTGEMRKIKNLKVWWYARVAIALALAWSGVAWLTGCVAATGPEEDVRKSGLALGAMLKLTQENKNRISNGCWVKENKDSYLLAWNNCADGRLGGSSLDATYKSALNVGTIVGTTMADNHNYYPGECVSMVKALSHDDTTTPNWQKGENVVESNEVIAGTAIATFGPNERYDSQHAGFFAGYHRDSYGNVLGIWFWDQNWSANRDGAVRNHRIFVDVPAGRISAREFFVVYR